MSSWWKLDGASPSVVVRPNSLRRSPPTVSVFHLVMSKELISSPSTLRVSIWEIVTRSVGGGGEFWKPWLFHHCPYRALRCHHASTSCV